MALMKTSNPALGANTFNGISNSQYGGPSGILLDATDRMTLNGTVNKTGILLICAIATAAWTWHLFLPEHDMSAVAPLMMLGLFGGFICAMVTVFKKQWSAVTAPIYALLEGLVLGGLSATLELRNPGIAMQAVALTFGTLFCLLMAYKTGLIRVTEKFRTGIIVATMAIALVYLVSMVLGFFHVAVPFMVGSSIWSIGFSLFVVGIAALNLVLDFDLIERGEEVGAPKYMEWYCGFGLMVTLVWLYIEILNLLAKLRSRD